MSDSAQSKKKSNIEITEIFCRVPTINKHYKTFNLSFVGCTENIISRKSKIETKILFFLDSIKLSIIILLLSWLLVPTPSIFGAIWRLLGVLIFGESKYTECLIRVSPLLQLCSYLQLDLKLIWWISYNSNLHIFKWNTNILNFI